MTRALSSNESVFWDRMSYQLPMFKWAFLVNIYNIYFGGKDQQMNNIQNIESEVMNPSSESSWLEEEGCRTLVCLELPGDSPQDEWAVIWFMCVHVGVVEQTKWVDDTRINLEYDQIPWSWLPAHFFTSASVGFCPVALNTSPSWCVNILPSPLLSNRENVSWYSVENARHFCNSLKNSKLNINNKTQNAKFGSYNMLASLMTNDHIIVAYQ